MSEAKPAFLAKQLGRSLRMFFTVHAKWISSSDDDNEMDKVEAAIASKFPHILRMKKPPSQQAAFFVNTSYNSSTYIQTGSRIMAGKAHNQTLSGFYNPQIPEKIPEKVLLPRASMKPRSP